MVLNLPFSEVVLNLVEYDSKMLLRNLPSLLPEN